MPDVYARVPDTKAAGAANRTSDNDATWLRHLIAASAEIDSRTWRSFGARLSTWYIDVPRACPENEWGVRLYLPWDIASITTLKPKSGSGLTFGTALAANTDYLAVREDGDSNKPILYLDKLSGSWTPGLQSLELVGYRGYSYETEDTGQTVQNDTQIVADGTSLTVISTSDIAAGEMLKIEDEQVYVSAVQNATTLTIVRAQNGTTAAAHANATAIYRRRYPREIEQAARLRAIDFYRGAPGGFAGAVGGDDAGFSSPSTYRQFMGLVGPYKRWGV